VKFEVHADLYLIRVGLDSSPAYAQGDQHGTRNLLLWPGRELEDREPVYAGDGEWGLGCPMCGHLDRVEAWSEAARSWTWAEAAWRSESTLELRSDRAQHEEPPQAAASSLPPSASAEG
jgi:hypothetical protein